MDKLNGENEPFSVCPRSRLRIWSRETGSAVPSRVGLLILHTQAESGAYSRDSSHFPRRLLFSHLYRQPPSNQSGVYRVTQLRIDGVHCRESASTGPVVLKVVPGTGAAFSGTSSLICLFSQTLKYFGGKGKIFAITAGLVSNLSWKFNIQCTTPCCHHYYKRGVSAFALKNVQKCNWTTS